MTTRTLKTLAWKNSRIIFGDLVTEIKETEGRRWSAPLCAQKRNLSQTLTKYDPADKFWLKIHPVTLGLGKRLFADGAIPAAYTLRSCESRRKALS